MNGFERRDGLTTRLMLAALEDRNAATCFGALSFGHLGSWLAHQSPNSAPCHQWTPPSHSHCGGHHRPPSPPPAAQTGSITGVLYLDQDNSGTRDAGESGVANKVVYADVNGDGQYTAGEPTATTAADGSYVLTGVKAGTVTVAAMPESGFLTPPVTVTVQSGQVTSGQDVPIAPANNS